VPNMLHHVAEKLSTVRSRARAKAARQLKK
jgi:hypothetical protein